MERRKQLYEKLINSKKVNSSSIGTEDEFISAISSPEEAGEFYDNLWNDRVFSIEEIGTRDQFINYLAPDFGNTGNTKKQDNIFSEDYIEKFSEPSPSYDVLSKMANPLETPFTQYIDETLAGKQNFDSWQRVKKSGEVYLRQKESERLYRQSIDNETNRIQDEINKLQKDPGIRKAMSQDISRRGSSPMSYSMMSRGEDEEMTSQEDYLNLKTAASLISDAKKTANASKNKSGFWKGVGDSLISEDAISLGLSSIENSFRIMPILDKVEKQGVKSLTPSENTLLEAASVKSLSDMIYESGLSTLYNVGSATGTSIPYMLQFVITHAPASAIAKPVMKKLTGYVTKRFGEAAIKKAAARAISTLPKVGTKTALKTANALTKTGAAALEAGATGSLMPIIQPSMYNDILERKMGQVDADINHQTGKVQYKGQTGEKSWGRAIGEGITAQVLDNWAEMSGGAIMKALRLPANALSKISPKSREFINIISEKPLLRSFNRVREDIAKTTGVHSIPGEALEEFVGQTANALTVGDQKLEDVYTWENAWMTLASVAPLSIGMGSASGVMAQAVKKKVVRDYNRASQKLSEAYSPDMVEYIKSRVAGSPEQQAMIIRQYYDRAREAKNEDEKRNIANEYRLVMDYAAAVNNYDAYIGGIEARVANEVSDLSEQIRNDINPDMNATVYIDYDGQMARVTSGNIVFDENGDINDSKSDDTITIELQDGTKQMVSPDKFKVTGYRSFDDQINEATQNIENTILSQEDTDVYGPDPVLDEALYINTDNGPVSVKVTRADYGGFEGIQIDESGKEITEIINGIETPVSIPFSKDQIIRPDNPTIETENNTVAEDVRPLQAGDVINVTGFQNPVTFVSESNGDTIVGLLDNAGNPIINTEGKQVQVPVKSEQIIRPTTYQPLSERQASQIISDMEQNAVPAPELALTPENWISQFGEDGIIDTPIGKVKMGENQYFKLAQKGRSGKLGMIKPTLEDPDVIIEDNSKVQNEQTEERPSSIIFIKTFTGKDGSRLYYFTSVTVQKEGNEVVVSNQEKNYNRISGLLQNGKVIRIKPYGSLHPTTQEGKSVSQSDSRELTSTDNQPANLGIDSPAVSVSENTKLKEENQDIKKENTALSRIPTDENGNPIYEQAETPDLAWDAIVEQTDGDEEMAQAVADGMVADKASELKKLEKTKSKNGVTVAEKIAAEKERKSLIDAAKKQLSIWQEIAGTANKRRISAESDRRRQSEEQAKVMRAEQERIKKEQEEAARIEREALNGVPEVIEYMDNNPTLGEKIESQEQQVNTNPSDAQKEAGNYKKGHIQVGSFNFTIEQPKGSVRRGTDEKGNSWEITMQNTYGYIRGTEGVDGDHIDVFLSNDIDGWNGRRVFVVDQYNEDGSFDEHKVMIGFNTQEDAQEAYFSNYDKNWAKKRKIVVTSVNLEDFEKWIQSSHRKTKPFAEYSSVKNEAPKTDGYNVERRFHKKNGTYIHAVKFTEQMPRERFMELKKRVKDFGGYYSSFGKGGFIFDNETDARKFAEAVLDQTGELLEDSAPVTLSETQKFTDQTVENPEQETPQSKQEETNTGNNPSGNRLVTDERYEKLKKLMRAKLGQLNVGIDPEILAIGTEMAVYHIEKGARKFAEYSKVMIADLGDVVRPYLKSFYNGARDLPEVIDSGMANDMTPYDDVRTFDVANFDKDHTDPFATAENTVAEQEIGRQAAEAKKEIISKRNTERRKENEQTTADTEVIASQAEAIANQAESDIEAATDERQINEIAANIDTQIEKVNEQLALLGYYEAEFDDKDFNEAYGYMRNAEKKAVKDANSLAKRLVKDLGITPELLVDNKGKRIKNFARANIAPAGGDVTITLPLMNGRELKVYISLEPTSAERGEDYIHSRRGDNLYIEHIMYRVENPEASGYERYGNNQWIRTDADYEYMLRLLKYEARDFLPKVEAQESNIGETVKSNETKSFNGYKIGDKVLYTPSQRSGKPVEAVIHDFENEGEHRPVLDTGLAPVLYEVVEWDEIKHVNSKESKTKSTKEPGKIVSSQKIADLFDSNNTDTQRRFSEAVTTDMLSALDTGEKPYRSILDLRKRASDLGMDVDKDGRTDILLQELVEDGLVRAARKVVEQYGRDSRKSFELICELYDMQPTIAARSSNRIKMQQYSTPLPMAWNAARFAMSGKRGGKVLEPTAGNGMLVFAIPENQVHVNELDDTRLDNLREQGFSRVTQQDATEPFEGGQQYDVVIANPPFGKREAVDYDGKMIPGLDPQITLNALNSLKDDGKAAIIIGGNMEYGNNGGLKSMKPFFTYLYDHYNVKGVVDMDGQLFAKQGTTFPTRMILISGRRSDEERAQTAVYPPVKSKSIRKAESFDELYEIIDEILNSKEKTNGTEVLRSQQGQLVSVGNQSSRNTDGKRHSDQPRTNDEVGRRQQGTERSTENNSGGSQQVLPREHRTDSGNGENRRGTEGNTAGGSRGIPESDVQRVGTVGVPNNRVELNSEQKKRDLTEEKLPYRPHNSAFSLKSVAPAAMVEAMDRVLSQIEGEYGNIDEFVRKELGYDTIEEAHQALAAEQMDSVAMAIYQMKKGQALIIGDQTGVGKGRQMAALIRWAVKRGEKPVFITQKADLFSDIYRDLVDIGSGDLVPFIFNSDGAMVDSNGNTVHKPLSPREMAKVFSSGELPDKYDFAVLTYSQVNTGDAVSQKEMEEAAKKNGTRTRKSKSAKEGKPTPKATFLRAIAENNYLFLDESHTAAGSSNTGAYLQSIIRIAKAVTFASATFAKRPDTMPLYAIRTAMSQAKVEPDKLINIIEKGGVTLQEIMSRELTNAGQMVRRERDMSDVVTDWKTIDDPETVKRARENYDRTIAAFNAIIKFQEDYVKPMVDAMDKELAVMAESAGIKKGTDKMGIENVPFASKTYNYTKQLMLALKVDAIANEVDAEIKAGRHPVIALESTMESSIKDYSAGEVIEEPTFSASLLRGLDTVMQYTITDQDGKEQHARYSPKQLGEAGEKAYYELQDFIRESTSDIFISPLDAIIERLRGMGYKVGELTGRNMYVERDDEGRVVARRRTDKDKKRMQREFNSGELDVLILNKSASTGISLHASEKFSDQRQRTMIIAQPLSDINDYMQMIGRIDRTGQVHRGYYINLGLPVPAENRFLMMLSTKLKSLNANTTTSQDSESNDVEAPDLLNKYGSQVVVEYLRDNPEIYEKMGNPLKQSGQGGRRVQTNELDEYKPQEDDARKVTGYVALLTTKEQEEFYDDVVRRYNELIKYLNDTGNNDLKITVMPLRAQTLDKRVSSEGIDPTGTNPFAKNSYVEQVEMDVLRKPMKAAEISKTIEQVCKGQRPEDYLSQIIATIEKEDKARISAEEVRYEKAKDRAKEDISKQTDKINRQQKRTEEEKRAAIAEYTKETNENVESKHNDNIVRINNNSDMLKKRLYMFEVGKPYLVPDNLESMVFDFSTPAIFCGYKAKDSKITASTTLAVFATLDGRRRIEIKLSQPEALRSIYQTTSNNWDVAQSTTLDNWDSQIPTGTRKKGFIMTGNILQAIADTQDEHGGYPGQLISYTDIDGNVHDGILMPDKWNTSMLKTSGAPIISRLKQIKDYMPVTSHDGKVDITGSSWAKVYYLTVPKTKKDGAIYYENKALLRAVNGSNFYPYRGKFRADIPEENIEKVVMELSKLGVKVKEETNEDDALYRLDDYTTNEEEANDLFRVVDDASEITRLNSEPTVKVYRAMSLVDGKLYPPMSKKIGTGSNRISQAPSEFGQWEVSDERPELVEKEGTHKNHIYIVKDNGKGLWVAYNPYFHTSRNPLNDQFAEAYQRPNLVTVEVEVPESELTSGYQAEGAKDPVGETKWNAGPVNRQLSGDKKRKVILSRWMRPVRIVPDSEVAQRIAELIEGENVAIPDNTVTPSLLEELKKLGVKIVDGISKGRKKATAMMRGGNGALTDNELSYENDPVAKMTGRSTRTAAQRRAFAERERQRMVNAVQKLAETLHLDNVDIVTDASTLQGRRAKAKGFYSRGTGRITIVIPNHTSVYDVEQTLLHEAVAHYGLRQLFGEHFDTFLDNVFQNADKDVRRRITELARERNWDFRTATEEYLASLAENTNFENTDASWWQKIKELFLRMLHKIGFENFSGVTLSDNELRYILWLSYENLAEPGRYRSILGEAADISKQYELKVGNYAENTQNNQEVAEHSDENLHRASERIEGINERFNDELQQQIDGTLPKGHVYELGNPSDVLLFAGIPNLPIEMAASQLAYKSSSGKHDFDLREVMDLPNAIANPIAVFEYGDKTKAQNILTVLEHNGEHFLVGMFIRPTVKGRVLEINSIRNVFPKNGLSIARWIADGKLTYANKEELLNFLDQQRTNYADVAFVLPDEQVKQEKTEVPNSVVKSDSKQRYNSAEVRKLFNHAAKLVESFENPTIPDKNEAVEKRIQQETEETLYRLKSPVKVDVSGDSSIEAAEKISGAQYLQKVIDKDIYRNISYNTLNRNAIQAVGYGIKKLRYFDKRKMENIYKGLFDNMNDLHNLQKAIIDAYGPIDDSLNAYYAENASSSRAQDRTNRFQVEYEQPLIDTLAKVRRKFNNDDFLMKYYPSVRTIIERQRVITEREIKKAQNDPEIKDDEKALFGAIQLAESKDYAGQTGTYKEILAHEYPEFKFPANFETMTYDEVKDFAKENKLISMEDFVERSENILGNDLVNEFWDNIRKISQYKLYNDYQTGMISRTTFEELNYGVTMKELAKKRLDDGEIKQEQYDFVLNTFNRPEALLSRGIITKNQYNSLKPRYEYYLPLKGTSDVEADDINEYSNKKVKNISALKAVEGHENVARDPLSQLLQDIYGSIMSQEQNRWRNTLLNMLRKYPMPDLYHIQTEYFTPIRNEKGNIIEYVPYVKTINGELIFVPTEEELKAKTAVRKRRGLDLDIEINKRQSSEHAVTFLENGDYVTVYFTDPRIAQSINNLNVAKSYGVFLDTVIKWGGRINRGMAKLMTTYSPEFVISNIVRDYQEASANLMIKEGMKYTLTFESYYFNPELGAAIRRRLNGKKGNTEIDKYVDEFFKYGGETAYNMLPGYEQKRKELYKEIKKANKEGNKAILVGSKVVDWASENIDMLTKQVELRARIATYITSRKHAKRAISRSIWDAKEVTVNFDKRGSWAKGFGLYQLFWNAGRQSNRMQIQMIKTHPIKWAIVKSVNTAIGFAETVLPWLLLGDDDRDKYVEKYFSITPYTRYSNYCFLVNDELVAIPVPPAFTPSRTLGVCMAEMVLRGGDPGFDPTALVIDVANAGASEWLPDFVVDPIFDIANDKDFAVSTVLPQQIRPFAEIYDNRNFFGSPIYNDNINEFKPAYQRIYNGTGPTYVNIAQFLNNWSGGDEVKKGEINLNPAMLEHLVESYASGLGKFCEKFVTTSRGKAESSKDIPVLGRFWRGDIKYYLNRDEKNTYHKLLDQAKEYKYLRDGYSAKGDEEKLNEVLREAELYEPILMIQPMIQEVQSLLKKDPDNEELKQAYDNIIEQINNISEEYYNKKFNQ